MNRKKIESFEDLEVYQRLCDLYLEISEASLKFPQFELFELGSQLRGSSNASPANIAEGWNNRHINIYSERQKKGVIVRSGVTKQSNRNERKYS